MDSFLNYTTYFINYPKALKCVEKKRDKDGFYSILKDCETNPELNRLQLSSFLIKPIQRITKYSLLFKVFIYLLYYIILYYYIMLIIINIYAGSFKVLSTR